MINSDILKLIRPYQWVKNFFVFIPMFFGGSLFNGSALLACTVAFVAFCLMASSVYCFNDIMDLEDDRRHPVKNRRPLASGSISVRCAWLCMAVLFVLSLASLLLFGNMMHSLQVGCVLVGYFVMNMLYCAKLKQFAIVDVCIVAFGFVLRIAAGGYASDVVPSKWLVLMTFLLTLFLSFAKRRDDVLRMNETGEAPRKNTIHYNLTFINQAITISGSVTLVCYIMYTVSPEVVARFHSDYLYLTSVFVLLALLRYIQLTVVDKRSGDPTKIMLHDRFLQVIILLWALTFLVIIYFEKYLSAYGFSFR
ncbi:MAG: decaprenyl-phosphate phosphoribosyltransferase [Prevotella sp.]|nr:decaprenyl-phosphate phosphoribosyltransferase [Prevotella sp.]